MLEHISENENPALAGPITLSGGNSVYEKAKTRPGGTENLEQCIKIN